MCSPGTYSLGGTALQCTACVAGTSLLDKHITHIDLISATENIVAWGG
jgi:hypothetical protein